MANELPSEVVGDTAPPAYGPRAAPAPLRPSGARPATGDPAASVRGYAHALRMHEVPPERMVPLLREYVVALLSPKEYLERSAEFISLGIRAYYERRDD